MSTVIKIKRSTTGNQVPTNGSLALGELAVNITDKKIYIGTGGEAAAPVLISDYNSSGLTQEQVEDIIAASLVGGVGIDISYGDTNGDITISLDTITSAQLASLVTDETGSGALVFATSPTLVTPALGTPSALVGTNITGTASGLTAGRVTTNADITGAITSTGNTAVLGSFTSLQLRTALSDDTGTGVVVFAKDPTFDTSVIGGATMAVFNTVSTTINGFGAATTMTLGATTGSAAIRNPTLTLGNTSGTLKSNSGSLILEATGSGINGGDFASLTITNTESLGQVQIEGGDFFLGNKSDGTTTTPVNIIFEGTTANAYETTLTVTDPTADRTITLPDATGTVALTANKLSVFAATTSSELLGVISDETGSGALVFATSPTLVTPALGTPASGVLTNCTGTASGLTVGTATTATTAATVTTAAQPSITSVGTLTAVDTSGVITGTNTTASTSSATGAVIIAGGAGIAKDSFINGHRIGVGLLASQTNLAVGTNALNSTIALGIDNVAVGYLAGQNVTSGANNVMLGSNAGFSNTTGQSNMCIGNGAHYSNQTGSYNVAIGGGAGHEQNNNSVYNVFLGSNAGYFITSGNETTCVGGDAGRRQADGTTNMTASSNSVYIGYNAKGFNNSDNNTIVIGSNAIGLGANTTVIGTSSTTGTTIYGALSVPSTTASTSSTTGAVIVAGGVGVAKDSYINTVRVGLGEAGSNNTTLGASTGTQLTAGSASCTMVGFQAGFWNTSGNGNTSVGSNCLLNTRTGSWNSALGINAIFTNQSGSHNVSVGLEGLYSVTGDFNTGIGSNSGYHLAGASTNNICIGYIAGKFHADGTTALTASSNSCYLGAGSRGLNNSDSNSIVIGSSAVGIGANTTVIGTSSTTAATIYGVLNLPSGLSAAGATFSAPISSTRMARHTSAAISAQKTESFSPTAAEDGTIFYINYGGKGLSVTLDSLPIGWRAKFLNIGGGSVFFESTGDVYGYGYQNGLELFILEAICIDTDTYFVG